MAVLSFIVIKQYQNNILPLQGIYQGYLALQHIITALQWNGSKLQYQKFYNIDLRMTST